MDVFGDDAACNPALTQLSLCYLFENEVQHQRIVEAVFWIKDLLKNKSVL